MRSQSINRQPCARIRPAPPASAPLSQQLSIWVARLSGAWRQPQPHRGSRVLLSRYLRSAGWCGHAAFLLLGALAGYAYGSAGGSSFFADLYPVNQAGSLAGAIGLGTGVLLGLLALWVLCLVLSTMLGALAYCIRFKGFPLPK